MRDVLNAALKRGWVVIREKRHYIIEWPKTGRRTSVPRSTSDYRAVKNKEKELERIESGYWTCHQCSIEHPAIMFVCPCCGGRGGDQ
jgi:ribosomal protein L37AE/L43A